MKQTLLKALLQIIIYLRKRRRRFFGWRLFHLLKFHLVWISTLSLISSCRPISGSDPGHREIMLIPWVYTCVLYRWPYFSRHIFSRVFSIYIMKFLLNDKYLCYLSHHIAWSLTKYVSHLFLIQMILIFLECRQWRGFLFESYRSLWGDTLFIFIESFLILFSYFLALRLFLSFLSFLSFAFLHSIVLNDLPLLHIYRLLVN